MPYVVLLYVPQKIKKKKKNEKQNAHTKEWRNKEAKKAKCLKGDVHIQSVQTKERSRILKWFLLSRFVHNEAQKKKKQRKFFDFCFHIMANAYVDVAVLLWCMYCNMGCEDAKKQALITFSYIRPTLVRFLFHFFSI